MPFSDVYLSTFKHEAEYRQLLIQTATALQTNKFMQVSARHVPSTWFYFKPVERTWRYWIPSSKCGQWMSHKDKRLLTWEEGSNYCCIPCASLRNHPQILSHCISAHIWWVVVVLFFFCPSSLFWSARMNWTSWGKTSRSSGRRSKRKQYATSSVWDGYCSMLTIWRNAVCPRKGSIPQ